VVTISLPNEDQMTFRSFFRITLVGCSLWACVSQYTSPGGEVEETEKTREEDNSESRSGPVREYNSGETSSSNESKDTPDEAKREPTEASGSCDDRSCVSASDCCKGYQCAFDPERSKVIRYCLPQ
jgi:hypothetical protein